MPDSLIVPGALLLALTGGLALLTRRRRIVPPPRAAILEPPVDAVPDQAPDGTTDLRQAVDVVFAALRRSASRAAVTLEQAVRPGLRVSAHPAALQAALHAAVESAIHSDDASRILVTARPGGASVEITVADDADEHLPPARDAVVRNCAAELLRHGAFVVVEHRVGYGTVVTFRVPAAVAAVPAAWADEPVSEAWSAAG